MDSTGNADSKFGEMFALVVGLGLVLGGVVNILAGGEIIITTILVLVGAGALSGWVKARQQRIASRRGSFRP